MSAQQTDYSVITMPDSQTGSADDLLAVSDHENGVIAVVVAINDPMAVSFNETSAISDHQTVTLDVEISG